MATEKRVLAGVLLGSVASHLMQALLNDVLPVLVINQYDMASSEMATSVVQYRYWGIALGVLIIGWVSIGWDATKTLRWLLLACSAMLVALCNCSRAWLSLCVAVTAAFNSSVFVFSNATLQQAAPRGSHAAKRLNTQYRLTAQLSKVACPLLVVVVLRLFPGRLDFVYYIGGLVQLFVAFYIPQTSPSASSSISTSTSSQPSSPPSSPVPSKSSLPPVSPVAATSSSSSSSSKSGVVNGKSKDISNDNGRSGNDNGSSSSSSSTPPPQPSAWTMCKALLMRRDFLVVVVVTHIVSMLTSVTQMFFTRHFTVGLGNSDEDYGVLMTTASVFGLGLILGVHFLVERMTSAKAYALLGLADAGALLGIGTCPSSTTVASLGYIVDNSCLSAQAAPMGLWMAEVVSPQELAFGFALHKVIGCVLKAGIAVLFGFLLDNHLRTEVQIFFLCGVCQLVVLIPVFLGTVRTNQKQD